MAAPASPTGAATLQPPAGVRAAAQKYGKNATPPAAELEGHFNMLMSAVGASSVQLRLALNSELAAGLLTDQRKWNIILKFYGLEAESRAIAGPPAASQVKAGQARALAAVILAWIGRFADAEMNSSARGALSGRLTGDSNRITSSELAAQILAAADAAHRDSAWIDEFGHNGGPIILLRALVLIQRDDRRNPKFLKLELAILRLMDRLCTAINGLTSSISGIARNDLPSLCVLLDSPYWETRKVATEVLTYVCVIEEEDEMETGRPSVDFPKLVLDALTTHASSAGKVPPGARPNPFRVLVRSCLEAVDSRGIFGTSVGAGKKLGTIFSVSKDPGAANVGNEGMGRFSSIISRMGGKSASSISRNQAGKDALMSTQAPDDSDRMSIASYPSLMESDDGSSRMGRSIYASSVADGGKRAKETMDFLLSAMNLINSLLERLEPAELRTPIYSQLLNAGYEAVLSKVSSFARDEYPHQLNELDKFVDHLNADMAAKSRTLQDVLEGKALTVSALAGQIADNLADEQLADGKKPVNGLEKFGSLLRQIWVAGMFFDVPRT